MSKVVQEKKEGASKKKEKKPTPVVLPGDLRSNKGSIYLRDDYIPFFRQPYLQGLPESYVPILLFYLMSGYSRDMWPFWNLLVIHTVLIFEMFHIEGFKFVNYLKLLLYIVFYLIM